jgi:hypothetical protein
LSFIYFPTDWKGLATVASWLLAFPLSLTALLIGAVAYFNAHETWRIWEERIKPSHPKPGDPDYLDWANQRGKYAGQNRK